MRRYRLNKRKFARFVLVAAVVCFITGVTVDVIRYPEKYLTTWRYQMQMEEGRTA